MLVDKYKPQNLEEIISQKSTINHILEWLEKWKPGKALMLEGPPGVGKNLIVELIAKERGLKLLEINASDKRDAASIKKLIPATKDSSLFGGRLVLIDEADPCFIFIKYIVKVISRIFTYFRFLLTKYFIST